MIERTTITHIKPSPAELAFCFCNASSEEQAMFFNEVARIVEGWDRPFPFQLEMLRQEKGLTRDGREVMRVIGEYGYEGEI
jgi:hypothetical protein